MDLVGKRILVVEDEGLVALDLKITLEGAGMIVIGPAARLPDALLLAEKALPDAAVLDVRLEVGTTLPLAAWLAKQGVPFLFLITYDAKPLFWWSGPPFFLRQNSRLNG